MGSIAALEESANMIDLYAAPTSNGMRARIALEECGLAFTLHRIALDKGEHRTPQFLALNPNAAIPVIVDRDGPGGQPLTLTQSTAILIYCAEKSGKYLPAGGVARAAMWEALMSASTDITPTFGAVNAVAKAHPGAAEVFKVRLADYFRVWDERLDRQSYAAGAEVTIADFSLYAGYWRTQGARPEVLQGMPALERWSAGMALRPAVQRALKF
jgi:GST-like protein